MELNLTELIANLKKLRTAEKKQNYSDLIADIFMVLMRKNLDYVTLGFCRSAQEVKCAYFAMRQDAIEKVKSYLSDLQLQTIPTIQQTNMLSQIVIGEKQLERIQQRQKKYPFWSLKTRHRLNLQKNSIMKREFDAKVWLSYLENQYKQANPQSSFIAEVAKFADKY